MVCREPPDDFLHSLGTVPASALVSRGQAGGPSSAEAMGPGEDLLILLPWLGDAFDKKHGFEAPSDRDGDEVLEHAMARLHVVRVTLSDGQGERTPDFRTRFLGGHGTLAGTGSADGGIQGDVSTMEAWDFCKQHGLQVSMRFNPRDLGDCAAGISASAWSAQLRLLMHAERCRDTMQ